MISNIRKFKHYDSHKLTEVGFCPSVKSQVESFTQAGKVLAGAQDRFYHFVDDKFDDNMEGESIYNDKIDSLERINEFNSSLADIQKQKILLQQQENEKKSSESTLQDEKKDV